ncbi:MAG: ATP-binding protein, partial [Methanobrevibacter sp.]|nr:ATP-binding protein [Methanobrevibacter sp.]
LGNFYQILKVNDKFIKFIFITGISKFAHVSLFSKLNSLYDLSLKNEFNGICGYSQDDLKFNFQDHIQKLANKLEYGYDDAINEIKSFYDGYSWNGEGEVYNPYSTLLCLKDNEFAAEWFNTGTPTVLTQYPMSTHSIKAFAEPTIVNDDELRNSTTENIRDEIFLFQTGYLTVASIDRKKRNKLYNLKIPNLEVKNALLKNLINQYSKIPNHDTIEYAEKLLEYVIEGSCEKIIETLGDYLSPISNEIRGKDERYYHALIFMLLFSAKIHVHNEVHSYKGNADLVIEDEDYVAIIEFKQNDKKSVKYMINEAMDQIEKMDYTRQYKNKKIVKGAIVFKKGEIGCKLVTQEFKK